MPDLEANIKSVGAVLALLPRINILVMKLLLSILQRIAQKSEKNKMTPSNLAIVFAPSLLRAPAVKIFHPSPQVLAKHSLGAFYRTSSLPNPSMMFWRMAQSRLSWWSSLSSTMMNCFQRLFFLSPSPSIFLSKRVGLIGICSNGRNQRRRGTKSRRRIQSRKGKGTRTGKRGNQATAETAKGSRRTIGSKSLAWVWK